MPPESAPAKSTMWLDEVQTLRVSVSALGITLSISEQVEFLTDIIEACDHLSTLPNQGDVRHTPPHD
jgi:hypothetical protein